MRINTITCHDVYNHGATLQAFALQTYLERLGHEVNIIDYKPEYLSNHFSFSSINPRFDKPIIKWLYLIAKFPGRLKKRRRKAPFVSFNRKYYHLTRRYYSFKDLIESPPEADVYIAGSDQIWNTLFQNGRDPAFYLDFVPAGKKRISYAASFGVNSVDGIFFGFVKDKLSRLDYVSTRERKSLPLLSSLGRDDACVVCDPVFLLNSDFWKAFSRDGIQYKKPYLLVYDFEGSSIIKEIAKQIALEKGLSIISVSPWTFNYVKHNYFDVGPIDFLSLIANAEFVISNSFHATAFSLIFNRNFCVIKRSEDLNVRMSSLLTDLGLEDRIVNKYKMSLLSSIDYRKVNNVLSEIRIKSEKFIDAAIEN